MDLRTYKATLWWMTAAQKLLGFKLRVSGMETLPDRPTMFVSNHFTRIETFLTPYALFAHTGRPVRSLSTPAIFRSWFGRYVELLGGMSLRDPRRNITIISELMTGREDWLIYPEGGLVKNKKLINKGRLELVRPSRTGPPHTGAALLALKAEISKRRYLDACRKGDTERRTFYEQRYHLEGPEDVHGESVAIVPVNITFYPFRPGVNMVQRLARRLFRSLDPNLEEELQVEGKILLGHSEVVIHFGEPIDVREYLDRPTTYARKLVGLFSETRGSELALGRQARRLTEDSVRSIYASTEINIDHLFCAGLYALDREVVEAGDFHRALYLTAARLAMNGSVRVHPSMHNGIASMVSGGAYGPLDDMAQFARESGIARRIDGHYHVNLQALHDDHDFHRIRLENPVKVISNELQPLRAVIADLQRSVRLGSDKLRRQTTEALVQSDKWNFERDYERWAEPGLGRAKHLGEPFYLESGKSSVGVVLVHGYLGCPEQMRPMAEYLHDRGMSVYGVRLSGHGTSHRQLQDVTWNDWMDSVLHGYSALRQTCRHVIMLGFSMGGALALLAASRPDLDVEAVVNINTPLRIRDRRLPFIPAMLHWNSILQRFSRDRSRSRRGNDTESPGINYDHHYLETVRELRRTISVCRRKLGLIRCPVLTIQSEEDPLVTRASGRLLLSQLRCSVKLLCELPFDRHMIVRGPGSEMVYRTVGEFITRTAMMDDASRESEATCRTENA